MSLMCIFYYSYIKISFYKRKVGTAQVIICLLLLVFIFKLFCIILYIQQYKHFYIPASSKNDLFLNRLIYNFINIIFLFNKSYS